MNIREVRKRAWETRRKNYGHCGHSVSAYNNPFCRRSCDECPSRKMIVRLYVEGILSEGQATKAANINRLDLRQLALDALNGGSDHAD